MNILSWVALWSFGENLLFARRKFNIKRKKIKKVFNAKINIEVEDWYEEGFNFIVVDVFVWHRAYGKISAPLNISTMKSVERFMEDIKSGKSRELMNITDGYHYHTVRADSETALDVIEKLLENKGYLAPEK